MGVEWRNGISDVGLGTCSDQTPSRRGMSLFLLLNFGKFLSSALRGFGGRNKRIQREPHYSPGSHIMDSAHRKTKVTQGQKGRRILFTCRTPYTDWI